MGHRIGLLVLVTALMTPSPPLRGTEQPLESPPTLTTGRRNVLFLVVEDVSRLWLRHLFEGFSAELLSATNPPTVYFESLDTSRFERTQYVEDIRTWLLRKYSGTRIDLIVAVSEDALRFLAGAEGSPWPNAQVLFFESGSVRDDLRAALPQAGGILIEDHFPDALRVITTILPETRRVALVYGASAVERARWESLYGKARNSKLEPIEIAGMSMDDTLVALGRLPDDTVVLFLNPYVDSAGHVVGSDRSCKLMTSASRVPTFSFGAHDFGCGVVGGLMRDWKIIGQLLADEALARLTHPSTAVKRVPASEFTTLAFDSRQLERWRIGEARLPRGAVVQFRQPSLWRDYRALVLTALAVTLVQSLLIAGLVFEHRRRRHAEMESRRHLAAMAHLDRRAAMGELATSLAHELNQPLNAILQNAGVAQMVLTANAVPPALAEIQEIISDIRKDDLRASEVIRRMRNLLEKHELESQPVDLNEVAQEAISIVRPDARSRGIQLEMDLAERVRPIRGDRVHLLQVMLNLLLNAMDAVGTMPGERRHVLIRTSSTENGERVEVVDKGPGIPAERVSEIFEPFYTTKTSGSGMGMGLAIARSIVSAHSGRIVAANNPDGGATVAFTVPASPGPESSVPRA